MNCKVGEMLPAAAPPLDDENLLSEILLRLPPLPSSLPRASAVCKRWRSLASDPAFSRRFRLHHRRNPPLLGFLANNPRGISYIPTMEAPDRVPDGRFSLHFGDGYGYGFRILGCRHGLVLISLASQKQVLVWDPVTGDRHRIAIPPEFDLIANQIHGAVLRAAGEVHHFQVVLVEAGGVVEQDMRLLACAYSSETGVWDGGGLGLLSVSDFTAKLWKRTTDGNGVASWGVGRTIEVDKLLSLNSEKARTCLFIIGFAEENNVVFLPAVDGVLMVQLESLQFRKLNVSNKLCLHPFESVYTAGI